MAGAKGDYEGKKAGAVDARFLPPPMSTLKEKKGVFGVEPGVCAAEGTARGCALDRVLARESLPLIGRPVRPQVRVRTTRFRKIRPTRRAEGC